MSGDAGSVWGEGFATLPVVRAGESLAGLVLRMDRENYLGAGQTLRQISLHGTALTQIATPGSLLQAGGLDLAALSRFSGLAPTVVESLTARPLIRWLWGANAPGTKRLGQRRRFAVCPRCFAVGLLPVTFLFAGIDCCSEHGLRLVECCEAGHPLSLFNAADPGVCLDCAAPLRLREAVAPAEQVQAATIRTAQYADLFAVAREPDSVIGDPRTLARAVRALLYAHRGEMANCVWRRLYLRAAPKRQSLGLIMAVLDCARAGVSDLVTAMRSARWERVRAVTDDGTCPNPHCAATETWSRGHAAWGEREYICRGCGTRFTRTRTLFSFDAQPGYPTWRAHRNAARLDVMQRRLESLSARHPGWTHARLLRAAQIPKTASFRSDRAGTSGANGRRVQHPAA